MVRFRTIIASLFSVLALAALPAASHAMTIRVHPGTIVHTISMPAVAQISDAGSAGVPGYDDAKCQELLGQYNDTLGYLQQNTSMANWDITHGYAPSQDLLNTISSQYQQAGSLGAELTSNCLTVD